MSTQEIYEITRNYAVVTAIFLILSVIGIYLLLKRKDDHLLGIVTSVFQIAISFAMLNMNVTITLLHDGMGADDTVLVKFCLYGWILQLVLMAVSAIITIRNILKQRKKQNWITKTTATNNCWWFLCLKSYRLIIICKYYKIK